MAVPKSKKEANQRWDKENMITLGCRVKRTEADTFKKYSASQGKTANTVLKEYVLQCNYEYSKQDDND